MTLKATREVAREIRAMTKAARGAVVDAVAAEAVSLVAIGFETSTAPDGSPWAPLKARDGRPLRDTGRLMSSVTSARAVKKTPRGFRLGTNVAYAGYHQEGTRTAPARPFLPGASLPPAWEQAFDEAAREALEKLSK